VLWPHAQRVVATVADAEAFRNELMRVFRDWQEAREKNKTVECTEPEQYTEYYSSADFYPALNYYFGDPPILGEIGFDDKDKVVVLAKMRKLGYHLLNRV